MTKKRILIIYAGGTIGMQNSEHGYVPVNGFADLLEKRLQGRSLTPLPHFDLIELPDLIDSANIHPSDWTRLAKTVQENWGKYDGFVILHGTDTMSYTASALSFIMQNLSKPVILTGAQIPLIELRNDAFHNIVTSLMLAADYHIPEVCIYFNGRILRGNRSRKLKSTGFDAFDTPNFPRLGSVGINIELNTDLLLSRSKDGKFHLQPFEAHSVAIMQMYPGLDAKMFNGVIKSDELKAIVVLSYGVGNPPDKNKELIKLFADAYDKGIVVVNVSQCIEGAVSQGAYATGSTLNRVGVIPGGDMTLEAAFAKLHYMISLKLTPDEIRQDFLTPYCGECSS
jgi:L-asparaginase